MAFDNLVKEYNREYLKMIIEQGKLVMDDVINTRYTVKAIDKEGCLDGYTIDYFLNTGVINRTDKDGQVVTFGLYTTSNDKRGYTCFEMCVPFNVDLHTNPEQWYLTETGVKSVQHTCYIHSYASMINAHLAGKELKDNGVANHKDGCKLHNWASNIEDINMLENIRHGAVINSIFRSNSKFKNGIDRNNKYTFQYTDEVPANLVVEYMSINSLFSDAVMLCMSTMRENNKNGCRIRWINTDLLNQFYEYLNSKNALNRVFYQNDDVYTDDEDLTDDDE